jgi:hypothetical protein
MLKHSQIPIHDLSNNGHKPRVDDDDSSVETEDAMNLLQRIERTIEVVKDPGQGRHVEYSIFPWKRVFSVCDLQSDRWIPRMKLPLSEGNHVGRQIRPIEMSGASLCQAEQQSPGGTPHIKNVERAQARQQQRHDLLIPSWGIEDRMPEHRIITFWESGIERSKACSFVPIILAKSWFLVHRSFLPLSGELTMMQVRLCLTQSCVKEQANQSEEDRR